MFSDDAKGHEMDFSGIIGQRHVVDGLINAVRNERVGHAYIFSGPSGIGKKSVAKAFAGMLLCKELVNGTRCGSCMPCQLFLNGSNPDFYVIGQGGSSIGIDEIRNMQSDVIVKPMYSKRKVYLIQNAENMTVQAQNCLLKTLEEPPGYAVLILTTSNYFSLMETIRSRSLRYNFIKNNFQEVKDFLKEKIGNENKEIDFLASYADGVIGKALELAESTEFTDIRKKTFNMLDTLSKESKLVQIFDMYDLFEKNKDNVDIIFDVMILFYRDVLACKKTGKENMLINSDKKDMIISNASNYTTQKLIRNVECIEEARKNIKQNANYQLSIEVMLMRLQEE